MDAVPLGNGQIAAIGIAFRIAEKYGNLLNRTLPSNITFVGDERTLEDFGQAQVSFRFQTMKTTFKSKKI